MRSRLLPGLAVLLFGGFLGAALLGRDPHDPLAVLHSSRPEEINAEASVPTMCYTRTAGASNPCWTCHVEPQAPNHRYDVRLQEEYAFSEYALKNRWTNLFRDRRREREAVSDGDALAYIRDDNYRELKAALSRRSDYPGYRPDLDFARGFDEEGFARDGSAWRALRFKPFPGTFWPTNGASDDVMIRLPGVFRPSRDLYKVNLALLEAAVADPPGSPGRVVEEIDEVLAGFDLDGDGRLGKTSLIRRLPPFYAGAAASIPVLPRRFPRGTEFLHTVRYLDPDAPGLRSRRMKEVRYSRKFDAPDDWAIQRAYDREDDDKEHGRLPWYAGSPAAGFRNRLGWLYQGFIEDAAGRLRVQTTEEHRTCMGCHTGLGVTMDSTFTLTRKVPGKEGWRPQDLRGMPDVPQHGHAEPEVLTYFRRVGAGDELRSNDELLRRFFQGGAVNEGAYRAAPDLAALLTPSRERALELNKAYWLLVREQSFAKGRDPLLAPAQNVHAEIKNGQTDLGKAGRTYPDGTLWLDWRRALGP